MLEFVFRPSHSRLLSTMNAKSIFTALLVSIALLIPAISHAELPAKSREEIDYLLNVLGSSNCEFNRNGSWYSAAEARDHLRSKFDYLLKKNLLKSSEDFIELGAPKSSMGGKAYQGRCANSNPIDSGLWLNEALRKYRLPKSGK